MANGELRRYKESKRTVEKQRATRIFLAHLGAYIIGTMIVGLWNSGTFFLRDNDNLWFWLPLLFWGIGVVVHYLIGIALFDDWWDHDEREVDERLRK